MRSHPSFQEIPPWFLGFFELVHHARKPGKALLAVLLQPLLVYIWGIHLELKVQGIQMIAH
ncbi:hypothetical protein [Trichocoleus sp. ST-U2]